MLGGAESATTKAARTFLVRGEWVMKRPTLKRDPQTGKEIENKVKWDKRYLILADTTPPAVYWYKNDAVSDARRNRRSHRSRRSRRSRSTVLAPLPPAGCCVLSAAVRACSILASTGNHRARFTLVVLV